MAQVATYLRNVLDTWTASHPNIPIAFADADVERPDARPGGVSAVLSVCSPMTLGFAMDANYFRFKVKVRLTWRIDRVAHDFDSLGVPADALAATLVWAQDRTFNGSRWQSQNAEGMMELREGRVVIEVYWDAEVLAPGTFDWDGVNQGEPAIPIEPSDLESVLVDRVELAMDGLTWGGPPKD